MVARFSQLLTCKTVTGTKSLQRSLHFCALLIHLLAVVSELGFSPNPETISAIHNMPTHSCKQHFQTLLDMIIYLSKYIPNMSELTAALRSLLKGDVSWAWFPEHDSALTKIKTVLSSAPVLRFYDTSLPTTLQVDASKDGLGACLMQQGQPVAYASRALSNSEINYAPIAHSEVAREIGSS